MEVIGSNLNDKNSGEFICSIVKKNLKRGEVAMGHLAYMDFVILRPWKAFIFKGVVQITSWRKISLIVNFQILNNGPPLLEPQVAI